MLMTNVVGASSAACSCESWLAHWEKYSGQTVTYCPVVSCYNKDLCGAHVRKSGDLTVYIYPLCNAHNKSTESLEVSDSYTLVSSSKSQTCEKSIASRWGRY